MRLSKFQSAAFAKPFVTHPSAETDDECSFLSKVMVCGGVKPE